MLLISHRGATSHGPENSWSAFEEAIRIGCHRIELDLHLTLDHEIVVIHDENLDRTTNYKGKVSDLHSKDLEKIQLKNGERIPLFKEVVEKLLPRIEINAEIKDKGEKLAELAGNILKHSPHQNKMIFSSFYKKPLQFLRNHFPNIQRAVLWGPDTLTIHPFYFFFPLKFLKHCESNTFHPQVEWTHSILMKSMKKSGCQVIPWVPMTGENQNPHKLWIKMIKLGIHGLCTNKPAEFKLFLEKNVSQ